MEIVEDRYDAGSTLITSQLPVEAWHEVIGEPTFADAILDRIVHNAYRLALEGPSMRKPEAIADDLMPSLHRELAGDQRRTAAIAILDDLHQIPPLVGGEPVWAPVVEQQQIDPGEHAEQPCEAAVALG